jgi:hypothetical protein
MITFILSFGWVNTFSFLIWMITLSVSSGWNMPLFIGAISWLNDNIYLTKADGGIFPLDNVLGCRLKRNDARKRPYFASNENNIRFLSHLFTMKRNGGRKLLLTR